MKKKNRKYVVIPLLLLLLLVTVGGTVAWLTATNSKTNTFTVGKFVIPEKLPDGSTDNEENSYLVEPAWDTTADHKLLPGKTYAKDPTVGLGAESEPGVVYVYVTNNLSNKVYFTLGNGWAPVTGYATPAVSGAPANSYTSGLFKYTSVLTPATSGDTWTTPLFNAVVVDSTAGDSDITVQGGGEPQIVVKSFIHQAYDASNNAIDEATVILPAVKTTLGVPANNNNG